MTADDTGTNETPAVTPAGADGPRVAQAVQPQLGIKSQFIRDLSFENPSAPERPAEAGADGAPAITVNVQVEARGLDETNYEVTLLITANARQEEKPVFLVELTYAGVFTFIGVPGDAVEPALLVECPRLLFPFARRIIADVTRDGGYPPLLLTPIDFLALYRNRQVQTAQAAQTAQAQPTAEGTA